MTIKDKYEFVKKEFALANLGEYEIIEIMETPRFLDDEKKYKQIKKECVFPYELTDKATEQDYKDYIKYVLEYCGYSEERVF